MRNDENYHSLKTYSLNGLAKYIKISYNIIMKNFEDLTITDDYMFCTVMQDEGLCKTLLSMVLKDKIGEIEKIIHQAPIDNQIGAKGIRLDIMVQDKAGKIYDIEMQTTDQKNLPKRMRYYQCAIDSSILNKGKDYNDLPDTFIIFFCTFDYINKGLPIYTLKTMSSEVPEYNFKDGVNKIIVNSKATAKVEPELKAFLEYMNGNKASTNFTQEIEKRINTTKEDENRRREYMLITSFEMDARRTGIKEGLIKTIKNMKLENFDDEFISKITGLSVKEIEDLYKITPITYEKKN